MDMQASHNMILVAVSVAIAMFTSFTALNLAARLNDAVGPARLKWLVAAAVSLGGGIWSMHFVGMLALKMPMRIAYDLPITAFSLAAPIAMAGLGLHLISRMGNNQRWVGVAGLFVGMGVVVMHYVGMSAMIMPGVTVTYDPAIVTLSVVIALVAATVALWLAFRTRSTAERLAAAAIMGIAIAGMHYTALYAATFTMAEHLMAREATWAHPTGLAAGIGGITVAVLSMALITAYFEGRLAVSAARDARRLDQSKALLRQQNDRFEWALNNMAQGLCMFDGDHRLIVFNRQYAETYRIPPERIWMGQSLQEVLDERWASGNVPVGGGSAFLASRLTLADGAKAHVDITELEDGRFIEINHRPLPDGGWVATHQDVTTERRMQAEIRYLAEHDVLTGLPNRAFFQRHMAELMPRIDSGEVFAILFIDLDRFKPVNDTFGHATGDAVLEQVGKRILECLDPGSIAARIGGDEFAVVHGPLQQASDAADCARRLVQRLGEVFEIGDADVQIGATVGIAVSPGDGTDSVTLMKNADFALYEAKARGRGDYRFFEASMNVVLQRIKQLEADLGRALKSGQLSLAYQPFVNLQANRISGCEALLRWLHPELGPISPAEFIPIAERTGQISSIGEWVLRQACQQAATWPAGVSVAVNLSPVQFKNGRLEEIVVSALAASGLKPGSLELEITETILLTDSSEVLATLHRLREIGVKIALDDFGTGFSSLSYLRTFPFDKLKVDRSFVNDLSAKPESQAILRAAAALGSGLGMITTAEGVETADQLRIVREQGYTQMQGYYFSRPQTAEDLEILFADQISTELDAGDGGARIVRFA